MEALREAYLELCDESGLSSAVNKLDCIEHMSLEQLRVLSVTMYSCIESALRTDEPATQEPSDWDLVYKNPKMSIAVTRENSACCNSMSSPNSEKRHSSGTGEGCLIPFSLQAPLAVEQLVESDRFSGSDSDAGSVHREPTRLSRSARSSLSVDGYECINNYMIIDTIGKGQYGKVILALDQETNESFAVKLLPISVIQPKRRLSSNQMLSLSSQSDPYQSLEKLAAHDTSVPSTAGQTSFYDTAANSFKSVAKSSVNTSFGADGSFQREIAILKKLRHKHIVALYEVIEDMEEETLYLVMQYAENGPIFTLDADNKCTPLPEDSVKKYMRQILSGLSYLEKHKVIHRDIKPDNILLSKNDEVVIADFGLSEVFGATSAQEGGITKGTPAFMAPEILQGKRDITGAIDVWSAGVTCYCMLFGEMPFKGDNWRAISEAIQLQEVVYPSGADPVWIDLLEGMLCKDPTERSSLQALRRHPLMREGRKLSFGDALSPSISTLVFDLEIELTAEDIQNAFTSRAPIKKTVAVPAPPSMEQMFSVTSGRSKFLSIPSPIGKRL